MELKRLWDTLVYFNVLPIPSCLLKLSNSKNMPSLMINLTLITDDNSDLAQKTIDSLQKNNTPLRIITSSPNTAFSSPLTEILVMDLDKDILPFSLFERVSDVIFFPENDVNKLTELMNNNLEVGEMILFDFRIAREDLYIIWGAVDDVVMGGVSSSNLILRENRAIFTGIVSTNNNGGFVSVRSKNFTPEWDLSAYQGIRLRVKGDGKRYKFITRCEGKWDGISYCYSFDTINNQWITVDIPFDELIPVFRAKTLKDAPKFDSSKVYSLQLMLSKFEYDGGYNPHFEAGGFSLEIEWIKVYGKLS